MEIVKELPMDVTLSRAAIAVVARLTVAARRGARPKRHADAWATATVRDAFGEPPMRLALLRLSPEEFAALAHELGPDGAAAVAASRPRRVLGGVVLRSAARTQSLIDGDRSEAVPAVA